MPREKDSCSLCKHAHAAGGDLECRAHPPSIVLPHSTWVSFPLVLAHCCCGDFKKSRKRNDGGDDD